MWTRRDPVRCLLGLALCLVLIPSVSGKTIYVDDDATGANDASSWENAYLCLQDALAAAMYGDDIQVAQGTYRPDQSAVAGRLGHQIAASGDREATFQLKNGITIKGGYAGLRGQDPNVRDVDAYETVLSGDLNGDDVSVDDPPSLLGEPTWAENSFHVLTASNVNSTTALDGFTITGGNANNAGVADETAGSGIHIRDGSPMLLDCVFTRNFAPYLGGGIYSHGGSPTIIGCAFRGNHVLKGGGAVGASEGCLVVSGCVFTDNSAQEYGGATYGILSDLTINNCSFIANSANRGGGVTTQESDTMMANCVFSANRAEWTGGGILCEGGNLRMVNCTLYANHAGSTAGGVYGWGDLSLANCILWDNTDSGGRDESAQLETGTVNYCCIQGWTGALGGVNNHGQAPSFVDPDGADNVLATEDDDLRLLSGSPCVDAGDNAAIPQGIFTDLNGGPRIANGTVDLGAYEGEGQGLVLSDESVAVPEGGTAEFTVALAMDPGSTVRITVAVESGDADISVKSGSLLIFDSSNYWRPQTVTLSAAEDLDCLQGSAVIVVSAIGVPTLHVLVQELEDVLHEVLHVDQRARGAGNGTSWQNAFTNLQEALRLAATLPAVKEVRVAKGIYSPAGPSGEREATFQLINGVAIRGGYGGIGGRNADARDTHAHQTVLSGDLNGNDVQLDKPRDLLEEPNRNDNSFHVLTGSYTNATAVLDGFTITGGHANVFPNTLGGGMLNDWGSPTVLNCTFTSNSAVASAGMSTLYGSPTIKECIFEGNCARNSGAGIHFSKSQPMLIRCMFLQNLVTGDEPRGGAVDSHGSDSTFVGCTFIGNSAEFGGAIYNSWWSRLGLVNCVFTGNRGRYGAAICSPNSDVILTNCTFVGDRADHGSALSCADHLGGNLVSYSHARLANCILWDGDDQIDLDCPSSRCDITYSNVQGSWPGEGNIDMDPRFVDVGGPDDRLGTEDDNPRLRAGSPCIDAGNNMADIPIINAGVQQLPGVDADLNVRIADDPMATDTGRGGLPTVDMGAYEFGSLPIPSILYVHDHADGANTGTNWEDAFTDLQLGLRTAFITCGKVKQIWVAEGTYTPAPPGGDRAASFRLINDVALYGGFAGREASLDERDPTHNVTILSGDLGGNDVPDRFRHRYSNTDDNSYHVVVGGYTDPTAVLDGFTIRGGHADLYDPSLFEAANDRGAGLYVVFGSPRIRNCVFIHNSASLGGGIWCEAGSPVLIDCMLADNTAAQRGGGGYCYDALPVLERCTIRANCAGQGAGMYCDRSAPSFVGCTFRDNESQSSGGGVFADGGKIVVADCAFRDNHPDGTIIVGAVVRINGSVRMVSNSLTGTDTTFQGDGALCLQSGVILNLRDCRIRCDITGPGKIQVPLDSELTIEADALVDLSHETDPNGRIVCDGLLRIKDDAIVSNAQVNVTRASFEDNAILANCIFEAEAGAPYGQFFIEDNVQLWLDRIQADGDRYLDLDPRLFDCNNIHVDAIGVNVTEGIGGTYGGLFELRGRELPAPPYGPDAFLCPLEDVPDFGPDTWTLDCLELAEGAKLNLTNRFDFQAPYDLGGEYEVLYVQDLVLGPNSVLNTAFNRLYYETLTMHATAEVVNVPLLGFSLNNIAFDDENDFRTRVTHNSFVDEDQQAPDATQVHVERIVGHDLDPNGVMRMCNLRDIDPDSPTRGQTIHARAKGLFAKSSEEEIVVRFEYLFCDPAGGGELVIYLSDIPELLGHEDPLRELHYLEVARLPHPPVGRPGAAGSERFAVFEQVVSRGHLDFVRGTRIEFELIGPEGTCILINNWDPHVLCYGICLDVTGDNFVSVVDFLTVIGEYGTTAELHPDPRQSRVCLEGAFSEDGFVDLYDVVAWDWTLSSEGRKNLCYGVPLGGIVASAHAPGGTAQGAGGLRLAAGTSGDLDDLLILGKRNALDALDKLEDRLYVFDRFGQYIEWQAASSPRCNVRLVQDARGELYQINSDVGIVRLNGTNQVVVPPGQTTYANEPRHNRVATVYIGIQGQEADSVGRPILDAAFDQEYAYVVPVVVSPEGMASYTAAAKLRLVDSASPPYEVVQLFDDPPPPGDNQYRNTLREIEVDRQGRVYVLNVHSLNESDILWRYDPDGAFERLDLGRLASGMEIPDPIAMHMSETLDMLFLASAQCNPVDANVTLVHGFTVDATLDIQRTVAIEGMQHLTGITEDPVTGSLWAIGFNMVDIPEHPHPSERPFYYPCFATIPVGSEIVQAEPLLGLHDLALPVSAVWTGPRMDVSSFSGFASFAGRWVASNCELPAMPWESGWQYTAAPTLGAPCPVGAK